MNHPYQNHSPKPARRTSCRAALFPCQFRPDGVIKEGAGTPGDRAMGARAIQAVRRAVQAAGLGQRTDAELLADVRDRRDPAAFEALVRRHGPLVLSACRQVLRDESAAEDVFQATFVTLHQKAGAIRRQPSLAGWLFRVARRTALRARRARSEEHTSELQSLAYLVCR